MGLISIAPPKRLPIEPFTPNHYYGCAMDLRAYSGYRKPIKAVVAHGVFYEPWIHPSEREAPVPAVFNWPAFRDEAWSEHKTVVPCAAPYLYALQLHEPARERRGSVFMPQHSTDAFDIDSDWWELAEIASSLPKPVTVCIYYADVRDYHAERYFDALGCRVVTMGHYYDPLFNARLVALLTGAERVVSNEIGSYTYYAVASGTPFYLAGRAPVYTVRDTHKDGSYFDSDKRHPEEIRRVGEMRTLFGEATDEISSEQAAAANYMLRADAMKTPAGLLADLEYVEALPYKRRMLKRYLTAKGA